MINKQVFLLDLIDNHSMIVMVLLYILLQMKNEIHGIY
jgi:hypothetical protein